LTVPNAAMHQLKRELQSASNLDLTSCFATLRTLNARLGNLRTLVYEPESHVDVAGLLRISARSKLDRRGTRAARRRGVVDADVQRRFACHVNVDFIDASVPSALREQLFQSLRIYVLVRDSESRFGGSIVAHSDHERAQPLAFFTGIDEVFCVPMVPRYGRLDCTVVFRTHETFVNGLVPTSVLRKASQATLNALADDSNGARAAGSPPFVTRAQHDGWIVNDAGARERTVSAPTAIDTALRLCGVTLNPGDIAATTSVALCNETHVAARRQNLSSAPSDSAAPPKKRWPRVAPTVTEAPKLAEQWRAYHEQERFD
jgi:hypothetical protein